MNASKSDFIKITFGLMLLTYAAGFCIALFSSFKTNINYVFILKWELVNAVLFVAAWAPAVLFVASALAMESSMSNGGFSSSARLILLPAFIFAAALSVFYLLCVPYFENKKHEYETKSRVFSDSIRLAEESYKANKFDDTERYLRTCAAINRNDGRYTTLYDKAQISIARAAYKSSQSDKPETAQAWDKANALYTAALQAQRAGKLFEAHDAARKALVLDETRSEIRLLVEETWRELQKPSLSPQSRADAAFYKKKLEAYARFQEAEYLEAYRSFTLLNAERDGDADVSLWLERSREKLSAVAFFIQEDEEAFSDSYETDFSMTLLGLGGQKTSLKASAVSMHSGAAWFRDMRLSLDGASPLRVNAPHARLRGQTLMLRAVDKNAPARVWNPSYDTDAPVSRYALTMPFDETDIAMAMVLSGPPEDIPVFMLMRGLRHAARYSIDAKPLYLEAAKRISYPFAAMMLMLIGAGLGLGFRAREAVRLLPKLISAPILSACVVFAIQAVSEAGLLAARALAAFLSGAAFIAAWCAFLCLCLVISLVVSAAVSERNMA